MNVDINSTPYKVKPFPYEFCEGCLLNGCYDWSTNPLLLCSLLGGIVPTIQETVKGEKIPRFCHSYKLVTEDVWQGHLNDLKREAKLNEECRRRAMTGDVYSNNLLPAEQLLKKIKPKKQKLTVTEEELKHINKWILKPGL